VQGAPPVISSFDPAFASTATPFTLVIRGTHFRAGLAAAVGMLPCADIALSGGADGEYESVCCEAPPAAAGTRVPVSVTNADETAATSSERLLYQVGAWAVGVHRVSMWAHAAATFCV